LLKSDAQDHDFYRTLWATLTSGKTWQGRMVNRKKDGALFTEDATISPVRDAEGNTTCYVAVKRDITSFLELEAQFLHAQKMEGVGRLAGGVAHDFNNLVTVIMSFTAFALESLREGDPLRDDLLEVKNAADRAAALTRQLLALSRKQILQPERVDLNQVLTDMDSMLRRLIGEDIEVAWAPAPDLGLVMADRGQIEQVLMNLAINARDAMVEGGTLTIETANAELDEEYGARHIGTQAGPHVVLTVSDTGCGMDEATRRQIFDPFFTTKETGKGTGLGLSTVYGIVEQSGGTIWVYSEPGLGTTFKVYLPRLVTDSMVPASEPSAPQPMSRGRETILVVEDQRALRQVIRRTLEAAGYTVLTAANGLEALAAFTHHEGPVQLLLTDVVMPEMSGTALVGELANRGAPMAVLYMSGYSGDAIAQSGVLEPGTHFLAKPFTPADLARKVRTVLDAWG
jgi:signal transduction histidine kinase